MKRRLAVLAAVLLSVGVVFVWLPGSALAGPTSSGLPTPSTGVGVGLPIFTVSSDDWRPPGFSSTAAQAITASEHSARMLAIHAREHPLRFVPRVWLGTGMSWLIDFYYQGKLAAEVVVNRAGRVAGVWTGPLAQAVYARGNFATRFGAWWVLVPFSLLFLLVFLDPRRPLRLAHLDAVMLLSLLISYLLFDHAKLISAVWTVYPPLIYLLARMLWTGGLSLSRSQGWSPTSRERSAGLSSFLSTRFLVSGLAGLVIARIVLSLVEPLVVDVGYASVIGAHQIAVGHPLYVSGSAHGDTYGPIAYLAYLPFERLFPWSGKWDYLPSAHAASLTFDLVTILTLVLLGRKLRAGRDGLRLGLALGWAWAACPFTLLALMMHTNDGLIAMLSVLGLFAFSSPAARGALLGLAAAAKFFPAALLGLYAGDRRRGLRGALVCVGSFTAVAVISIGLYLPTGGLKQFYDQTVGFQLGRTDVFSAWALHPGLDPVKLALEVGVILLCAAVAFFPRRRSLVTVCALAGAITIAIQLPAVHWFYYYVEWFAPFVLVVVLAGREPSAAPPASELELDRSPVADVAPVGA